jgi:hypothetical protein
MARAPIVWTRSRTWNSVSPRSWRSGLEASSSARPRTLVTDRREQAAFDPVGFVALLGRQIEWESGHRRGLP